MAKNIVILFDGTSNEISTNRTNILRLFGTLEKSDGQIVYYSPGVGTFGADNSPSYYWRKAVEIIGMATGWGIDQNVKQAYRFLTQHHDAAQGDQVYLFGFSRGAYTARVLAGFINAIGLIPANNINLLDAAYKAYKGVTEQPNRPPDWREMDLYDRILAPVHPSIRCLGLFDTVASVIEWGRYFPGLTSLACTSHNPSVQAVRHAVSIAERRSMFQPTLWPLRQMFHGDRFAKGPGTRQDARELWFSGVHGDVGGGVPEGESALAKIPLHWMIAETRAMGLIYREDAVRQLVDGQGGARKYVAPDVCGAEHVSMNWAWALLEFVPRRVPRQERGLRRAILGWYLPLFSRRHIAAKAAVHVSVRDRAACATIPPNLPADPVYES